jgi:hypothetical protein
MTERWRPKVDSDASASHVPSATGGTGACRGYLCAPGVKVVLVARYQRKTRTTAAGIARRRNSSGRGVYHGRTAKIRTQSSAKMCQHGA